MKKVIPLELTDDCIEIYQEVIAKKETDSIAVLKIKDFLKENGLEVTARTVYRYLNSWKKESSISCITESFEVDLSWENDFTKEAGRRLFKRFCEADDNPKSTAREIREWFSSLRDCIETGIKIDVIRAKKTTTAADSSELASKIVVSEKNED